MRTLFLIENIREFPKDASINQSNCVLLDLDNFAENLKEIKCKVPVVALQEKPDKELLEKKFLDLIAMLGEKAGSIYWWASALSEKNSFVSKLFVRIYKLVCMDETIQGIPKANIVVVCSDAVLTKQLLCNYQRAFRLKCSFLFFARNYLLTLIFQGKGILKLFLAALAEYKQLLCVRYLLRDKKALFSEKKDWVVLRTWVDRRNYKFGEYKDSYFAKLLCFISQHKRDILIFAGILSGYKDIIRQFKLDKTNTIVPANIYIKGLDIFRCLWHTYFHRSLVPRPVFLGTYNVTGLVRAELAKDISTPTFFYSLMQYYSCLRLAESVSVERFIYTFENYGWEKMSILGLRRQNPKIKIIGFQHAFVSKNSFMYFPGEGEDKYMPLPERLVTLGRRTREILQRLGSYPEKIFSIGCALRQEYLFHLAPLPRNINGGIFVPLTITIEDTIKSLRFLFESGLRNCREKVYLRFHPVAPAGIILKRLGFALPENFIISDNPLMHLELERASVVLYTWTTACLEALKMGRPVIYLDVNYPLEVDPLFECNHLKGICRRPADLIGKINRMRSLDSAEFAQELKKAQDYLAEYFAPVNEENLATFLA